MKQILSAAAGAAIGTLIYTVFISSAQQADWGRAVFVGLVCGCAALFVRKKRD